eukprot:comp22040_c0_seq1/m.32006 comp22040_c0_seq1/g.32006  ORF comp22040_c0_seq1/g.32006 comp22040_c0_seq1/m.32006 type:complete len:230 (-) comp22040_c0_seq1:184-873(-)
MKILSLFALAAVAQALVILPNENAEKVRVELYMEAMCPFCSRFMSSEVKKAYNTPGLDAIYSLEVIPYGNARVIGPLQWQCQHGPNECNGNILMGCAINLLPNNSWFPYVSCLEETNPGDPASAGPACAKNLKVNYKPIGDCASSDKGKQIHQANADRTNALNPPHRWVPWLVINGDASEATQNAAMSDFVGFLCKTYTGPKPSACEEQATFLAQAHRMLVGLASYFRN